MKFLNQFTCSLLACWHQTYDLFCPFGLSINELRTKQVRKGVHVIICGVFIDSGISRLKNNGNSLHPNL